MMRELLLLTSFGDRLRADKMGKMSLHELEVEVASMIRYLLVHPVSLVNIDETNGMRIMKNTESITH